MDAVEYEITPTAVDLDRESPGQLVPVVPHPPLKAGIIDAVQDQHEHQWIRYGTAARSRWFSVAQLHSNEREVFRRLSAPGVTLLTTATRTGFKLAIERHQYYRPALVAAHPGWLTGYPVFVMGDGAVTKAEQQVLPEVIIAFDPDPKFSPMGTVGGWKYKVGAVVKNQPIPLFVLSYGFIAPLLRFAPPHVINPLCEVVGPHESGKTILAAAAESVWAGDPSSDTGGAESWDQTLSNLDVQKVQHADMLLVLDEANLAGETKRGQRELVGKGVFKLAGTGGKKRFTDTASPPEVRVAVLSTSNENLGDLIKEADPVRNALTSRMVTIRIPDDGPYGVLKHLPEGFANTRVAMEDLRATINRHYGKAGRRFVLRLARAAYRDRKGLERRIAELLNQFNAKVAEGPAANASKRHQSLFGMAYVSASLAQAWEIFPRDWGAVDAIDQVFVSVAGAEVRKTATERLKEFAASHAAELVEVTSIVEPYSETQFQSIAGFFRTKNGQRELLIPSDRFKQEFPDHLTMMRDLRKAKLARTEGGKTPKLTIKVPKHICARGRVYCVKFDSLS